MRASTFGLLRTGLIAFAGAALAISAADAGTLDTVKQAKAIRLAVRDDAPPFSYKDKSGQPAGYMVDLCRAVVKHLAGGPRPRRPHDRLRPRDRRRPVRRDRNRQGGSFVRADD